MGMVYLVTAAVFTRDQVEAIISAGSTPDDRRVLASLFSECSEQALDYAVALAGVLGAKLHLFNVIGPI